jgi:uncharacterized protein (DUF2147 family)
MRKFTLAAALVLAISPAFAQSGPDYGDALGNWSRDDGNAKVRLAPCGAALCATNTWIKDPASSEKVGDRLEMTLRPSGAQSWKGTAYDPQRQKTYDMTMSLKGGKLNTRGCLLTVLCKNVGWTRIR